MIVSEKPPAALKKRKLSTRQLLQPKTILGHSGEQQALSFLISKKYKILDTNVSGASGENDIVAFDVLEKEIVFCEVKTRSSEAFGHPTTAVNWKKIRNMQRSALEYLRINKLYTDFRLDLITVTPHKLTHYKNLTI